MIVAGVAILCLPLVLLALARRGEERAILAVWRGILSRESRPIYELFAKRAAARERAITFTRAAASRARRAGGLLHAARLESAAQEFEETTIEEGRRWSLVRRMLSALQ